jgi:hypothetical protein
MISLGLKMLNAKLDKETSLSDEGKRTICGIKEIGL